MKIVFAGGATGGHFYPIIAVAEEVNKLAQKERLAEVDLYFMSNDPYDRKVLFENHIEYVNIPAGKVRRYFSLLNVIDFFKTIAGIIVAIAKLYVIFPDVVFGKGGYASFPTLVAARVLGIPVFIHESDSKPGRVNLFGGKFAKRIAISYPQTKNDFPKEKTALTGIPIRQRLLKPTSAGVKEFLNIKEDKPVLVVIGGSQGAERINDILLDILPELVEKYYVIHQTGIAHEKKVSGRAALVLENSSFVHRYKVYGYLNESSITMLAGIADLVITRAGATAIAEIAQWQLPSIVVPIPKKISHDQTNNAVTYTRTGAGVLLEETNLTPHILLAEINRVLGNETLRKKMSELAKEFSKPDAAHVVARELINLALEHER